MLTVKEKPEVQLRSAYRWSPAPPVFDVLLQVGDGDEDRTADADGGQFVVFDEVGALPSCTRLDPDAPRRYARRAHAIFAGGPLAGRAIRIFLADGTPSGLRTAELGLSTVVGVFASRGSLDALVRRPESHRTGVYVLIGDDPKQPGRSAIYVGEGDTVIDRVLTHDGKKDFWDRVCLFVSKDLNLTKAHVRFLEARLVGVARQAKRATVLNVQEPGGGTLPEADVAEMEEFLDHIRLLLGTNGVNAFDVAAVQAKSDGAKETTGRAVEFLMEGDGYAARCLLIDGEFVVKRGSRARIQEAPALSPSSRALRQELEEAGVLDKQGDGLHFAQDYAFGSPTGAAQVVCGSTVNGRAVWRTAEGQSLKDWQEMQLKAAEATVALTAH